ncbi:MAG: O-antigen ligase family protein [Clostridia bacterium]|nr:O-antigen ligase family protein [Clostridia bacterium]
MLILLLQISTVLTGYGRAVDALTAALLTSTWFFARRFWREKNEKIFVFFSSLSLLIVSAIGVGQYAFGRAEVRWVDASRFGDIGGRVTSLFSNPNILAVYLLLYFPFSLWATFLPENKGRMRVFYAITTVFGAICILLTWSRGAWLGLLLELFLFLLFHSRKTRFAIRFAPLLLILVPLLPSNFKSRLLSIGDLGESSIRYRLQTWQGALQMFKHYPFGIGVGERAWRAIYPHFAVSGTKTVMHAHNIFLQVATELGAVGLVVFLLLIGTAFFRILKEKNFTALVAVSGALVMGFFDHLWYYPGMLVPFWSMLAFCMKSERKVTEKSCFVDILHEK